MLFRSPRTSWKTYARVLTDNPQIKLFFVYLVLMLSAILGQDILLEPFGGEAFLLSVSATTRITSIWGGCVLVALLLAGLLEGRVGKRRVAFWGALGAMLAFSLIALSGFVTMKSLFYFGVILLGLSTGLATVSNLSLMLDMTTVGNVGLYIGTWGMANALARGAGAVVTGAVRDTVTALTQNQLAGYGLVFILEAVVLAISLLLLSRIDVGAFRRNAEGMGKVEQIAIASDAT